MINKKECPYCRKEIVYQRVQQFAGHCSSCKERPGYQEIRKRQIVTVLNKRKNYEFKCKKCDKKYMLSLTLYQYKIGSCRKHCSRKCANSGHIQTEQINDKRRQTILRKIKSGEIIPHSGKKGKLNHNYKENSCGRVNREIKLKTFDKFKGVCQECGKQLIKKEINTWRAHHNNKHINKEEYYDDEDRTLFCRSCHVIYHNKKYPKKNHKDCERYILFS